MEEKARKIVISLCSVKVWGNESWNETQFPSIANGKLGRNNRDVQNKVGANYSTRTYSYLSFLF